MFVHEVNICQGYQYLTAKIIYFATKQKGKIFTGLAIKLVVGKYCLTCFLIVFEDVCVWSKPGGRSSQSDTIYIQMLKKRTCKGAFYHVSGLIAMTKDRYFYSTFLWRNT